MKSQVNIKKTSTITIELEEHEAKWLKAFIQNPNQDDESAHDELIRAELYRALAWE